MAFGIWAFGQLADWIGRKPMFILFQVGASLDGDHHGDICERHNLRHWRAYVRSVPYGSPCDGSERVVGHRPGGGWLGPLAVGTLAAKYSFNAATALLASIYVVEIIATVFLIPELKGKPLE